MIEERNPGAGNDSKSGGDAKLMIGRVVIESVATDWVDPKMRHSTRAKFGVPQLSTDQRQTRTLFCE